jgi:hypothetical protein
MIGTNICFITRIIMLAMRTLVQQAATKENLDHGVFMVDALASTLCIQTICMVSPVV